MQAIIINDCRDDNARVRQQARLYDAIKAHSRFISVRTDIEAAGNLIDSLDAIGSGVILVNVAPRSGITENGSPFCFFHYHDVLVISSFNGYTLSLVKKFNLVSHVHLLGSEVFSELNLKNKKDTQFRSYELTPWVAKAVLNQRKFTTKAVSITEIPTLPPAAWHVDCFGNIKTTVLKQELEDSFLDVLYNSYPTIRDIPDGECGMVIGSSGLGNKRFMEFIYKGGDASKKLRIESGAFLEKI